MFRMFQFYNFTCDKLARNYLMVANSFNSLKISRLHGYIYHTALFVEAGIKAVKTVDGKFTPLALRTLGIQLV